MSSIGQVWDPFTKTFTIWAAPRIAEGNMERIDGYALPKSFYTIQPPKIGEVVWGSMKTPELFTKCCNARWHVHCGNEGTSFYVCNKCNEACDLK